MAVRALERSYRPRSSGHVQGPSSAFVGFSFFGPHCARAHFSASCVRCSAFSVSYQGPMLLCHALPSFLTLFLFTGSPPPASVRDGHEPEPCLPLASEIDRGH